LSETPVSVDPNENGVPLLLPPPPPPQADSTSKTNGMRLRSKKGVRLGAFAFHRLATVSVFMRVHSHPVPK
jgi:hypothetical protein